MGPKLRHPAVGYRQSHIKQAIGKKTQQAGKQRDDTDASARSSRGTNRWNKTEKNSDKETNVECEHEQRKIKVAETVCAELVGLAHKSIRESLRATSAQQGRMHARYEGIHKLVWKQKAHNRNLRW